MSRYGLLGMALIIALFVLVLLVVAPRPNDLNSSRRLARLGAAIEMYSVRHDGRLPQELDALADEELLPADFVKAVSQQVKYVAAGRSRDSLSSHGIVAIEDPSTVAGSILVHVLLADGAVLAMPADLVREAASRANAVSRVESAANGQLSVVLIGNPE